MHHIKTSKLVARENFLFSPVSRLAGRHPLGEEDIGLGILFTSYFLLFIIQHRLRIVDQLRFGGTADQKNNQYQNQRVAG
jgi:hypothetical protein